MYDRHGLGGNAIAKVGRAVEVQTSPETGLSLGIQTITPDVLDVGADIRRMSSNTIAAAPRRSPGTAES